MTQGFDLGVGIRQDATEETTDARKDDARSKDDGDPGVPSSTRPSVPPATIHVSATRRVVARLDGVLVDDDSSASIE